MEEEIKDLWQELKEVWKNSSHTEKINFQMSSLIVELKSKVSQFEKDSIKKDIKRINVLTSQFEKDSISNDIRKITLAIRKVIQYFKLKK